MVDSTSSLILREFDEQRDLSSQRELFALSFPENAGSPVASLDHYRWKFRSFPARPSSYEYVASDDEGLVGYYAALPYRYRINDRTLTLGMVCDVMTHPRARGKGVFTRLGAFATRELARHNIVATTGYPIRPEVIPGHLKVGWKIAFELPLYVKPIRAGTVLHQRGVGFAAPVADAILKLSRTLTRARRKYDIERTGANFFATLNYEQFLHAWLTSQRIALVKDNEFMQWRLSAPGTDYAVLVARDTEGRCCAVAIVRDVILQGIPTLAVLDIMTLPNHLRAFGDLARAIDQIAINEKVDLIATMVSSKWARTYRLGSSGFIKTPKHFSLIVKHLNDAQYLEQLFDEREWHLMWIDSDDL